MAREVKVNTRAIKSALTRLKYTEKSFYKAVAEYIWNGFDAKATTVEVIYDMSLGGTFKKLVIKDNGYGIAQKELLNKFEPFLDSEKLNDEKNNNHNSTYHGKKGVGRLTFHTFSNIAKWETVFNDGPQNFKYHIEISADKLENFSGLEAIPKKTEDLQGTTVEFSNFKRQKKSPQSKKKIPSPEKQMLNFIKSEFCWYLELTKPMGYKLLINGEELDYSDLLADEDNFVISRNDSRTTFDIRYIQWSESLREYSKFYYLNNKHEEQYKENTTLNNQSDKFDHSVFISSDYFKEFNFKSSEINKSLEKPGRSDDEFKYLKKEVESFLRRKRKPFLRDYAKKIIKSFEDEGIIVRKGKDDFQLIQIDDLEEVLEEIYTTQPKFLADLKKEQRHILVGLFNLVLNSNEREGVIELVDQIVKLDSDERNEFRELLKVTNLSRIIKTINLLKNRFIITGILEELLFNKTLGANEVDHLQKVVEDHTWIFGEEYSLVAAAEDNFEKALHNHTSILRKVDDKTKLDHPNKLKQVDLFLCRQSKHNGGIHNLIIELKHPSKRIGMNELNQVKMYMQTILEIPQFNGDNYTWDFILAGTKFDTKKHIEREIKNCSGKGGPGLAYDVDNYKIYVRKWSDILTDCDLRHKFLQDKLELEKGKLAIELSSPNEAVELSKNNSAGIYKFKSPN